MWKTKLAVERLNLAEEESSGRQSIVDDEKREHERLRILRRQDAVRTGVPLNTSASSDSLTRVGGSQSPATSMGTPTGSASTSRATDADGVAAAHRGRFRVMRDEVLGKGGFGVVFRGFDNERGEIVAVKETKIDPANRRQIRRALESEFATLQSLEHTNIVRVFALTPFKETVQIVMEWMPSGSVSDLMRKRGFRFHERVIHRYAAEALRGLAYLHSKGFLHRDIKPANMLVSGSGTLKLSDFGTCKQVVNMGQAAATTNTLTGTPYYLSPEACSGHFSASSDVWAFACSVVEMATAEYPWCHLPPEKHNPFTLVFHIGSPTGKDHHPRIPDHLSKELRDLLKLCFHPEAAQRPSAQALLDAAYFQRTEDSLPGDVEAAEAFAAAEAAAQEESGAFSREPSEIMAAEAGAGVSMSTFGFTR
uniref:Protein kinase domain-containing protein n=1 Tax=Neobodo designis TaxID=312471 RepID=A0A7S1M1V2_NEODS